MTSARVIKGEYLWPNELAVFNDHFGKSLLLIPDGFLLPGQSDGGLFVVREPQSSSSHPIRITGHRKGWFYHKAVHVKLVNGLEGIVTARAKKSFWGASEGELVWLTIPPHVLEGGHVHDEIWPEVTLSKGPDVMFEVTDIDHRDQSIEIVCAHFFGERLTVLSLTPIATEPYVTVTREIELNISGRPYGLCLATMYPPQAQNEELYKKGESAPRELEMEEAFYLSPSPQILSRSSPSSLPISSNRFKAVLDPDSSHATPHLPTRHPSPLSAPSCVCDNSSPTHVLVSTHECSYDFFSACRMLFSALGGSYPRVRTGGAGLRAGERVDVESGLYAKSADQGGVLYAYEIPSRRRSDYKREPSPNAEVNLGVAPTQIVYAI